MEKRAFERIPTSIKVELFCCNTNHHGVVRNCSENSMFISIKNMFFPFDSKFEVLIPYKEKTIKVPAKVTRLIEEDKAYNGIGVTLINPPADYIELVDGLKWKPVKRSRIVVEGVKTYVCRICLHVAFHHAPVDCPVCHASIENYENNPYFIKNPADYKNLTEMEKTHIPVITVLKDRRSVIRSEGIDVHIKVGEPEHGMGQSDYITFIDFYFNDSEINKRCLARVSLMCEKMQAAATYHLNKLTSGVITTVSHCSTHGSWMSQADV